MPFDSKEKRSRYFRRYYKRNKERISERRKQKTLRRNQRLSELFAERDAYHSVPIGPNTKFCPQCSRQKPLSDFITQVCEESPSCSVCRKIKRAEQGLLRATHRKWDQNNPLKVMIHRAHRRGRKLLATPPWAHLFMEQYLAIYAERLRLTELTGIQHHVDHIYPLIPKDKINGPYGLHVPWNLQVIEGTENCRKQNVDPREFKGDIKLEKPDPKPQIEITPEVLKVLADAVVRAVMETSNGG